MQNHKDKLEKWITTLETQQGSDLHLAANTKPMIRVDGELVPLRDEPELKEEDTRTIAELLLSDEQAVDFQEKKEIDLSFSFKNSSRFRVNCFYQRGAVGIAMRLIPRKILTLEELNLPTVLRRFTGKEQGFFLVVGPVGQGKTTTLAAMVDIINKESAQHILTIEHPIEYIHDQQQSIVDQREVEIDTDSFASAMKSMFRQDIDVVLVGEMRSKETMAAAVTAAETGHLIFSTLHTNSSSQTIDRIIDSFPHDQQEQIRVQLASSLTGILSQRLVQRVSGGLVPAYELLINNTAIANLIREGRTHEIDSVIETSYEQGMVSMNRSLTDLVRSGEVSIENARKYSLNPQQLEKML